MAKVAFGGGLRDSWFTNKAERDCDLDPDRAATELRQAGYKVFRLPPEYEGRLAHEPDDHIEAHIEGDDGVAIMHAVEAIVAPHGGICCECGVPAPDHVPFSDLLDDTASRLN